MVEPRKRKPTFEENFSYYLTDVVNHLKGFSNGASVYINVIDFIQKYIKHSEYSFGIS